MKLFLINVITNEYSEGDKPSGAYYIEVPQRPDWTYDWDGNQWTQNAAKLTQSQQPSKDSIDLAAIKADNILTAFVAMTPAQVDAWITANVTNLATATNALKILAKITLLAARSSLK